MSKQHEQKPYNDFSSYFKRTFKQRVQKISVDAGFSCPNRPGRNRGGCTYCNNNTFNPFYCAPDKSVGRQLEEGIAFFSKKYKTQKYLAYFQAYTNTFAPFANLKSLYEQALNLPSVIGLVISTRPDCINSKIINYLNDLARQYYIVVEFGLESLNDETLKKVNRGHTVRESIDALNACADKAFKTGVHLIAGLPGESRKQSLAQADTLSRLPFDFLKLHQLQIVKNTKMAKQYAENPEGFNLFSAKEYIAFVVSFLERLRPDIIVERFISQSPPELLIAPDWAGLKNYEISTKIEKEFKRRNSRQGKLFHP